MKEEILTLKGHMEDQRRGRSKIIVVVTGLGVPPQDIAEDPFEVAKGFVTKVTCLTLEKSEVKKPRETYQLMFCVLTS